MYKRQERYDDANNDAVHVAIAAIIIRVGVVAGETQQGLCCFEPERPYDRRDSEQPYFLCESHSKARRTNYPAQLAVGIDARDEGAACSF